LTRLLVIGNASLGPFPFPATMFAHTGPKCPPCIDNRNGFKVAKQVAEIFLYFLGKLVEGPASQWAVFLFLNHFY